MLPVYSISHLTYPINASILHGPEPPQTCDCRRRGPTVTSSSSSPIIRNLKIGLDRVLFRCMTALTFRDFHILCRIGTFMVWRVLTQSFPGFDGAFVASRGGIVRKWFCGGAGG